MIRKGIVADDAFGVYCLVAISGVSAALARMRVNLHLRFVEAQFCGNVKMRVGKLNYVFRGSR